MNQIAKVLIVVSMLLNTAIASAAFVTTNSAGANGFVTGAFPTFTLAGTDKEVDDDSVTLTTYTDTFLSDTTISFDWVYLTNDEDGSIYDKAGYVLNDTYTQLSPDNLFTFGTANGTVMLSLVAGDTFGWYIDATDGLAGRAFLDVSPSAVPVPAALPLMASALGAFGVARRRNQAKNA